MGHSIIMSRHKKAEYAVMKPFQLHDYAPSYDALGKCNRSGLPTKSRVNMWPANALPRDP